MKEKEYIKYTLSIYFMDGTKKEYIQTCEQFSFYKNKWQGELKFQYSPKQIYSNFEFLEWDVEKMYKASIKGISIKAIHNKNKDCYQREYGYDQELDLYYYYEQGNKQEDTSYEDLPFSDKKEAILVEKGIDYSATTTTELKAYLYHGNVSRLSLTNTIIIPEGVQYIEKGSFDPYSSFEEIVLPSSIEYIHPQTFSKCYKLKKVHLEPTRRYQEIDHRLFDQKENIYLTFGEEGNARLFLSVKDGSLLQKLENLDSKFGIEKMEFINETDLYCDNWKMQYEKNNPKVHAYEFLLEVWSILGKKNCSIFILVQDYNKLSNVIFYYWDGKEICMGTKENWKETNMLEVRDWMNSLGLVYSKKRAQALSSFPSPYFDFTRKQKEKNEKEKIKIEYEKGSYKNNYAIEEVFSRSKSIAKESFKNCIGLKKVALENVECIEESAFENCSSLEEINFPSSLKRIQANAFNNCTNLKRIVFQEGLNCIGKAAFKNCTSLQEIMFPDSIKYIEAQAFKMCKAIDYIVLPNIEIIENETFKDCISLKEVVLPDSLKHISAQAFQGCLHLEKVICSEQCHCEQIIQGAFKDTQFYKNTRMNSYEKEVYIGKYLWCANKKDLRIKPGTVNLDRYSIQNVENLWIPKSLYSLRVSICQSLSSLKAIEFEEGMYSILKDAYGSSFSQCKNLESVIWPPSLVLVHPETFGGCNRVIIKGKVGSYAQSFAQKNGLEFKGDE